jgi:hypothetical protein
MNKLKPDSGQARMTAKERSKTKNLIPDKPE